MNHHHDDPLAPARGIMVGCLLGVIIWALLGGAPLHRRRGHPMTARVTITLECNNCHTQHTSSRTTVRGARGDADRKGWHVQYLAGGRHPTKISDNPKAPDLCPTCNPNKPPTNVGLLAQEPTP